MGKVFANAFNSKNSLYFSVEFSDRLIDFCVILFEGGRNKINSVDLPEGTGPLGRPNYRWENTKINPNIFMIEECVLRCVWLGTVTDSVLL